MTGKLLDTNAVIALQKTDAALLRLLNIKDAIYIAATTIGELYYGAYNSARAAQNVAVIDVLTATSSILNSDAATAKVFGQIRHALKVKGRPIPENDIWIAAIALQHDLVLVTHDDHFSQIDGLRTETW